jgi:hypothetical protein
MGASATAPAATISPAALRPSTRCLGEIDVDVPRQPSCARYNVPQHRRNFLICQLLMRRLEEHRRILAPPAAHKKKIGGCHPILLGRPLFRIGRRNQPRTPAFGAT